MSRRPAVVIVLAVVIACAASPAFCAAERAPVVVVDGRMVSLTTVTAPGGQTLVWIRDLETLGWGRVESQPDGSVVLRSGAIAIRFTNGSARTLINKLAVEAPAAAKIVAAKFMVPLEFVCNSLGYSFGISARPVASIKTSAAAQQATQALTSGPTAYSPPRYQPHQSKPVNKYRPAATILQPQPPQKGDNRITGRVTFAGAPAANIRLLLTSPKGGLIPGDISASTNDNGEYTFTGLRDGDYRVYAYVGDNPDYFNRASPVISLANGSEAKPADITLGRVLRPLSPPIGGKVTPIDGKAEFTCSTCQSASGYNFSIVEDSSKAAIVSMSSADPTFNMDVSSLQPGHEYEWRVMAVDGQGEFVGGNPGAGMPAWTFSLAAP